MFLLKYFQENHLGMFLAFRQIDVLKLPKYGENITVSTGIYDCKGPYGYRNTVLYDENQTPCIQSSVKKTLVFICC